MSEAEDRMRILEMIENGQISTDQGVLLLQALLIGETPESPPPEAPLPEETANNFAQEFHITGTIAESFPAAIEARETEQPGIKANLEAAGVKLGSAPIALPPEIEKWRRWWMLPVWAGGGLTLTGAGFMYWALRSAGLGFWFTCAALPFLLGILVIALAWQTRNSPWLHLRVQQKPGRRPEHIALSLPIPPKFTAWFLRTFGSHIQGLQSSSLDELILAVSQGASAQNPLYIQVDEGQTGEKVEIYLG